MKPHIFQATALGFEMAISVVLGAFLGRSIDVRFGLEPWGMVVGVIIGSVVGFMNIYRFVAEQK